MKKGWATIALVVCCVLTNARQGSADPPPSTGTQAGNDPAEALNAEVLRLLNAGQYTQALPLAEQALRLREQAFGSNDVHVAESLNNLAVVYQAMGQYERALPLHERALRIRETALGPNHPNVAENLNNLAEVFRAMGQYERALPLHERALRIRETALGTNHPDVATSLNNLAAVFVEMGQYERALPLHERALRIFQTALGPNHPDVAKSLNNLALVFRSMGQYERALPLHERALRIRETALGPNHPDVANSLNNLALVFREMGQRERALPLLGRALRIRETALGTNHPDVATSLNGLAAVFVSMGQYERAVPLLERALRIRETALGPNHPDVADSLNDLAEVFRETGRYERALPLHERALLIREAALGPNHPNVAENLNNLAEVFRAMGQYERAMPLLERALRIREAALGPNPPDVANSLNNLAEVFRETGRYERALPLYERALRILETVLGPDHPNVANSLNNLAGVYRAMGQYERAQPLFERALHVNETVLGPNHPNVANSLNNLAEVFRAMGQYERAMPLLERAQRIEETTLGSEAVGMVVSLNNLANVYLSKGQYERAVSLYSRALILRARSIQSIASRQCEERVCAYLRSVWNEADALISLSAARQDEASSRRLGLLSTLLFKARGEEELIATLATLRRSTTPEDHTLLDEWDATRQRLAALSPMAPAAERARFEAALEAVEERMARRSTAIRERREFADHIETLIPRVAAHLAADAALIELVSFKPINMHARTERERWGSPHYAAFVLHHDGTHAMVDLGEAAFIDTAAHELSSTAVLTPGSERRRPIESVVRAGATLEQRLFVPIARLLQANVRRLVFAPDGPLHLAPLHLMHDGHAWLLDRYVVSYVTSGRDLLRERDVQDAPSMSTAIIATHYPVPEWNLPALTTQATLLPRLVPGIRVLRDESATETALRDVSAPLVLHVGAHGQFLDDTSAGASLSAMQRGRLLMADVVVSQAEDTAHSDGYATAAELLSSNLRGTRLVVLSACETARGSTSAGNSVFGLRRALLLAGTEALIVTEWSVDERAGAIFTVALYEGLRRGMRSANAVTRAIRLVRERDPDPFAWAPFVLVGRDDVIDWNSAPQPSAPTAASATTAAVFAAR